MIIFNACPLCLLDAESVNHLLLYCRFASQILSHFLKLFGIVLCVSRASFVMFNEAVNLDGSSFRRNLWKVTVLSIVWSMWLERKKRVFQGKVSFELQIIEVIKFRVVWWIVGLDKYRRISFSYICRDWASVDYVMPDLIASIQVPWSPLDMGLLKITLMAVLWVTAV